MFLSQHINMSNQSNRRRKERVASVYGKTGLLFKDMSGTESFGFSHVWNISGIWCFWLDQNQNEACEQKALLKRYDGLENEEHGMKSNVQAKTSIMWTRIIIWLQARFLLHGNSKHKAFSFFFFFTGTEREALCYTKQRNEKRRWVVQCRVNV